MQLKRGKSKEVIKHNIATLVMAGKPMGIAIRQSLKRAGIGKRRKSRPPNARTMAARRRAGAMRRR